MRKPVYFTTVAALFICLLGAVPHASAQMVLPKASDGGGKGVDTKKVYDVVEQMPTLPDGGGNAAIADAIQHVLVLPAGEKAEGRVMVEFVVDRKGRVQNAKVLQAPTPALGKAVLSAVAKLPPFKPGMQNGETTNVRFQLPILLGQRP